jgi:tRNA nucleotidyltransferase/poly(A) polymerase
MEKNSPEEERKQRIESRLKDFPLTKEESVVFAFLLEVAQVFNLNTTLRVAGGWVRDKLLKSASDDIDIALDNIMGKNFAEYVNELLAKRGEEIHTIGVIETNPEQSKHLETATMRVFGTWIDFVNLRAESYTENSRIPTIRIGTPKEDALRRDLTINSLYYNVNTGQVEDHTGRGVDDLCRGIIRTPLPPLETFLDDPLRVLRAIRFACRLQFHPDPELLQAAKNEKVQVALRTKVSRERIGKELEGMLKSSRPDMAFNYLHELGLFDIVFELPKSYVLEDLFWHVKGLQNSRKILLLIKGLSKHLPQLTSERFVSDRRLLMLCSVLLPLRHLSYTTAKKRPDHLVNYIILDSVKFPKKDAEHILLISKVVPHFKQICQDIFQCHNLKREYTITRRELGLLLRETKEFYLDAILLSVLDLLPDIIAPIDPFLADTIDSADEVFNAVCATVVRFTQVIESHRLLGVWDMRPLVDGRNLCTLLNVTPGPIISLVLQRQIEWMLENPDATLQEAETWLKSIDWGKEKK